MASYNGRAAYSPSAPPLPGDADEPRIAHPYHPTLSPSAPTTYSVPSYAPPPPPPSSRPHSSTSYAPTPSYGQFSHSAFPPGTHPEVIRSFQMVDRDRSGFIEDMELQQALSSGYQKFSLRTIRLLVFLFKNPSESSLRIGVLSGFIYFFLTLSFSTVYVFIWVGKKGFFSFNYFLLFWSTGPKEFAALWSCLGQWRVSICSFLFFIEFLLFEVPCFSTNSGRNSVSFLFYFYWNDWSK